MKSIRIYKHQWESTEIHRNLRKPKEIKQNQWNSWKVGKSQKSRKIQAQPGKIRKVWLEDGPGQLTRHRYVEHCQHVHVQTNTTVGPPKRKSATPWGANHLIRKLLFEFHCNIIRVWTNPQSQLTDALKPKGPHTQESSQRGGALEFKSQQCAQQMSHISADFLSYWFDNRSKTVRSKVLQATEWASTSKANSWQQCWPKELRNAGLCALTTPHPAQC